MIQTAICEDNPQVQFQLEEYLKRAGIPVGAEVFSSAEELLTHLEREPDAFSVYFMDISLPGMSGIEAAAVIRQRCPHALILFVTDYKEYVYQVFEVLPFRFLIKPVKEDDFQKALSDALSFLTEQSQLFSFHIGRTTYQLPCSDIYCAESNLRQVVLYTEGETYRFYGKFRDVCSRLSSSQFVRTHMSYLVNMEYIHALTDTEIVMRSGLAIPVSRRLSAEVRRLHLEYLKRRCI